MLLRKRLPADMPQVTHLLESVHLPIEGLEVTQGWVIEEEGQITGHVALELTPPGMNPAAAVLRSLAVSPTHQGSGHGGQLMSKAEAFAADRLLALRTQTIGPWMERRGFQKATLADVPESLRATPQFSGSLCAGTPVYIKHREEAMPSENPQAETIKSAIREHYATRLTERTGCCAPKTSSKTSCGCGDPAQSSLHLGYQSQDLESVPEGSNLGLGCGNPVALATLKAGETVLDLGSGAGFDAFLAARRVGETGRVIGVDMTPEMLAQARRLAHQHGFAHVEFRQGDIEELPVEDASVDAIISNCVINLAVDKAKVFREAFRVLKPGGRIMISDIVLLKPLKEDIRTNLEAIASCLGGALLLNDYLEAIQAAGFADITIKARSNVEMDLDPEIADAVIDSIASVQIQAFKIG